MRGVSASYVGPRLAVRDMCQGAPASPPYNDNDVTPG